MNELIYLIEIDRKISIDTHLLDLFPDEVYARNRGPLLPVAVDRIHLRGLRGRLQGELTVKPLRVVSFNIIIVCPRRETIYHESERTKKKERGGGSVSRYFHAIPQSQHTHPFQKTHNISLKRIYGSGSGCTPRNSFFRIVAFFAVGRASTSYRRGGCREGKQEITESKCSKELKKKKRKSEWICFEKFEQQRCDFFRLIRHSVALHPKEEEKRER